MVFAVSTYSSGRANFAAVSPLIALAPDRPPTAVADPEDDDVLQEMRARDRQVRAEESALRTAAGRYAGATSFRYERGPDGLRYAVEGETPVDTSPVPGDPQATVAKMNAVHAATQAQVPRSSSELALERQALWQLSLARAELRDLEAEQRHAAQESRTRRLQDAARAAGAYGQVSDFFKALESKANFLI